MGGEGEGFIQSLKVLEWRRIACAHESWAICAGRFEAGRCSTKGKQAPCFTISPDLRMPRGISFKLAALATKIEAGARFGC